MLISAVISILEDFGILLPARTVTVKLRFGTVNVKLSKVDKPLRQPIGEKTRIDTDYVILSQV